MPGFSSLVPSQPPVLGGASGCSGEDAVAQAPEMLDREALPEAPEVLAQVGCHWVDATRPRVTEQQPFVTIERRICGRGIRGQLLR